LKLNVEVKYCTLNTSCASLLARRSRHVALLQFAASTTRAATTASTAKQDVVGKINSCNSWYEWLNVARMQDRPNANEAVSAIRQLVKVRQLSQPAAQ
jgi:hypothetical protein